MLYALFSGDRTNSRVLTTVLLVIVIGLVVTPFVFPGARSIDTATRIAILILFAAAYDLLLGYTGIASFGHTMFFGLGGYGVALALSRLAPSYGAIALGAFSGIVIAVLLAITIALFSLRIKAIFFAMVTFAGASAFTVLVTQFADLTGGEDGLNYRLPREMTPAFKLLGEKLFGVNIDGRILTYYGILLVVFALFLVLLRIVNSPFGSVLKAIRENAFRTEAIGYRLLAYRATSTAISAAFSAAAGALLAIWLRYSGPATMVSFEIMIDLLLIVTIGGIGTMYGAVIGATLLVVAQYYLQTLMQVAAEAGGGIPLVSAILDPDRWLLWLGILFILSVYFFPNGVVGRLRNGPPTASRRIRAQQRAAESKAS